MCVCALRVCVYVCVCAEQRYKSQFAAKAKKMQQRKTRHNMLGRRRRSEQKGEEEWGEEGPGRADYQAAGSYISHAHTHSHKHTHLYTSLPILRMIIAVVDVP